MTRSIGDLRALLDQQSVEAPGNPDRLAAVERKIRERRRRRVATGAVSGVAVAALVVTGVVVLPRTHGSPGRDPVAGAVPQPSGRATAASPGPDASDGPLQGPEASGSASFTAQATAPTPPPTVYQGMKRVTTRTFDVTGRLMTVRFTPSGPDTAYLIQCSPGFEVIQQTDGAGGYGAFGNCSRDDAGLTTLFGSGTGRLTADRPHLLEVVVLPEGTVKENSIEYMRDGASSDSEPGDSEPGPSSPASPVSLDDYLAAHPPGRSSWSVAVYSGVCEGTC